MDKIKNELISLGMDEKLKGFFYSYYAIMIIKNNGYFININEVYLEIANCFDKKIYCIERSIRYAIEKTWEKGNYKKINQVFGYSVDRERGKPTNREFLFLLADKFYNIQ